MTSPLAISFIIPAHNEEALLAGALRSIHAAAKATGTRLAALPTVSRVRTLEAFSLSCSDRTAWVVIRLVRCANW